MKDEWWRRMISSCWGVLQTDKWTHRQTLVIVELLSQLKIVLKFIRYSHFEFCNWSHGGCLIMWLSEWVFDSQFMFIESLIHNHHLSYFINFAISIKLTYNHIYFHKSLGFTWWQCWLQTVSNSKIHSSLTLWQDNAFGHD